MARLTDSNGTLLGGLDTSFARHFAALTKTKTATIQSPIAAPIPPEYEDGEIVFALGCSYGSLPTLAYSSLSASQPTGEGRAAPRPHGCEALVEMPEERHYCAACGGYYCARHAEPAAHDCASVLRPQQS